MLDLMKIQDHTTPCSYWFEPPGPRWPSPQAISALVEPISLLGAGDVPIGECWRDQAFFASAMHKFQFLLGLLIKMTLCQILPGWRLDEYQYNS